MDADHALLSGEVKCSVSLEMLKTATFIFSPFLTCSLHSNLHFSYSGGGQRTDANFSLVYRDSLIPFTFDFSQLNNLSEL